MNRLCGSSKTHKKQSYIQHTDHSGGRKIIQVGGERGKRKKICCKAIKYNSSGGGPCEEHVIAMTHWCNPFKTLWLGPRLLALLLCRRVCCRLHFGYVSLTAAISANVLAVLLSTCSGCHRSTLSWLRYMTGGSVGGRWGRAGYMLMLRNRTAAYRGMEGVESLGLIHV